MWENANGATAKVINGHVQRCQRLVSLASPSSKTGWKHTLAVSDSFEIKMNTIEQQVRVAPLTATRRARITSGSSRQRSLCNLGLANP